MADIREVISKVMTDSKPAEDLNKAAMWDEDKKKAKSVSSYKITYDSQQNQLEPIYYWVLDFIQDMGWNVKKITDNFMSSPGSGSFAEMGQRASKMQEEGMKILGGLNQVIKSALNLIYDLKEFELRLKHYTDADSDDKNLKEGAILALKQIWLDNVDLKRGRGSIHQMAAELGYTTIREVFMMANSIDDLKKMNSEDKEKGGSGLINDQVMRILEPRIKEFFDWKEYSGKELKKRMDIEINYLRSQIETIKLYSSWIKPYLQAAEELRQRGFEDSAALVHAFSTTMFELTLMATKEEKAPGNFKDYNMRRKYFSCLVVTLKYRGHVSQRVTQKGDYGFAMGGRIDMAFDSYSLNEEEMKVIEKERTKDDVTEMTFSMKLAEESLKELKEDLDHFLKSDEEKKKEEAKTEEKKKEEKNSRDINPFFALFSIFRGTKKEKKGEKKKEIETAKDITSDNYIEKIVRGNAANSAAGTLYIIYDIYKKSHGMASAPSGGFKNLGPSDVKKPELDWKGALKSGFGKIK
ncbi:MAG: hypothetical protein Q8N88_00330 [Nanoarchaeota archaeon]|nr:hypothetical protein [Nanoarchaeota archaeon]